MQGGNTISHAVQAPIALDHAAISAGAIRLHVHGYAEPDAREDSTGQWLHDFAVLLHRGDGWAHANAPRLLPMALAALKAADALCDEAVGVDPHLAELFEALDQTREHVTSLLAEHQAVVA